MRTGLPCMGPPCGVVLVLPQPRGFMQDEQLRYHCHLACMLNASCSIGMRCFQSCVMRSRCMRAPFHANFLRCLRTLHTHPTPPPSALHAQGMLPAFLRASLPKPKHVPLGKRAAKQYHSRPRDHKTAHQMLHPGQNGPNAPRRRPLGKLEQMDLLVRQQVCGARPRCRGPCSTLCALQ